MSGDLNAVCAWCFDDVEPKVVFDSYSEGRILICVDGDACIARCNEDAAELGDWLPPCPDHFIGTEHLRCLTCGATS